MTRIPLTHLLSSPELDWIDWKGDFSPGLLGGKTHKLWDQGRGKLLRVLQSIANSINGQYGYVVYGVDNSQKPRTVVGISKSFDDADFQDWSQATFRPYIEFEYREEDHQGRSVGIFEIRPSANYPHVCERSIGGELSDGQVWLRRGTRCSIARHEDLRRMFEPGDPIVVSAFDGPIVSEIRKIWEPEGWEPQWPTNDQKADKLVAGERLAFLPGSRREIHRANHVLMLRRKLTNG